MKITLVVDNPNSWIMPYIRNLCAAIKELGHDAILIEHAKGIEESDITFLISCEKIIGPDILSRSKKNVVIHESAVPQGRGWSPLTWQILEGRDSVPITLFAAAEKVDSGEIYLQDAMKFTGHELVDELRIAQGEKTIELALKFIAMYPNVTGKPQVGQASYYPRRTAMDSELDIHKTLDEQFNLLRVVDNERYPAFFRRGGHTYTVKIYKTTNPIKS